MYGKVFTSMYDGTLVTRGPWQALVTFQQFIALCDPTGIVDMTPEVISRRTSIPLDIIKTGIAALEAPDPDSRSSAEEGRRIVRLADHRSWGWQIVNHDHYQKLRSNEDRRAYFREYQRKRRAKKGSEIKDGVNKKVDSQHLSTRVNEVTHAVRSTQYVSKESTSLGALARTPTPKKPNGNGHHQDPKGTRLPDDWQLPDAWKEWALQIRHDWTPQGVVRESITFRDYWLAKPNPLGRKSSWLATWRNWIRRADKEPSR